MSTVSPVTSQKTSQMIGDMKFVGIFTIVYGAITCLSIIGAIIGIPMIIAGLRLRESADFFTSFQSQKDENALYLAFEKQGSYFNIQKILIIIGLVIFGLYLFGVIIFAGIMASRGF
ncbi:DUF5362 domain-containing protein [candidate division KSB1 bacterium]|nr:DUF5362 domain-containing protein [candidate division KSB1 bacterium]